MADKPKYNCPHCGNIADVYLQKYDIDPDVFVQVYVADCASCSYSWLPIQEERKIDSTINIISRK